MLDNGITMQTIEAILNAGSGSAGKNEAASQVVDLFKARGVNARVSLADTGEELLRLAQRAARSDCAIVVAGGGDGTISAVAGELAETQKTLGVLPMGTLNHFAKDLHIPTDLEAAIDVIVGGRTIDIDAGEVNGRLFINNSSLGIYPDVVRGRERRQRLGYGKWHSLIRSAWTVFRRYPLLGVRLTANGRELATRTPFVFVGNNDYEIESFNIGARERLDEAHLSVYMTRRTGRLALLRIALRGLIGGLSQEKDFLSAETAEITIETRRRQIRVAIDGEVQMMKTPIRYRIRPRSIRVIVPEDYGQKAQDTAK